MREVGRPDPFRARQPITIGSIGTQQLQVLTQSALRLSKGHRCRRLWRIERRDQSERRGHGASSQQPISLRTTAGESIDRCKKHVIVPDAQAGSPQAWRSARPGEGQLSRPQQWFSAGSSLTSSSSLMWFSATMLLTLGRTDVEDGMDRKV